MENFKLLKTDKQSAARRGVLKTAHGPVQTPVFMPVGTAAAVKGLLPSTIDQTGASVLLANTYHLMLRPGVEIVEKLGGLHKIMAWNKPILTDSGGYQVFSLDALNKIDDTGVEFSSHVDGKKFRMDARIATDIQNRLGADIIMCFDQCTEFPCQQDELELAVKRTIEWAKICKESHNNKNQLLFGIVQGGIDLILREKCGRELEKLDFDGYALGGLSVGEGHDHMVTVTKHTAAILAENKPRYLMGVGTPADIVAAVKAGIDMFDCVMPTRHGRNGYAFTEDGPLKMRNSKHIGDTDPVEQDCDCYCCQNYSRGTIRHYFNVKEMLGPILLSIHNISFYQRLMKEIRKRIELDDFAGWADEKIEKYKVFNG